MCNPHQDICFCCRIGLAIQARNARLCGMASMWLLHYITDEGHQSRDVGHQHQRTSRPQRSSASVRILLNHECRTTHLCTEATAVIQWANSPNSQHAFAGGQFLLSTRGGFQRTFLGKRGDVWLFGAHRKGSVMGIHVHALQLRTTLLQPATVGTCHDERKLRTRGFPGRPQRHCASTNSPMQYSRHVACLRATVCRAYRQCRFSSAKVC